MHSCFMLISAAAISMTLCELKTAQYQSTPMECAAFSLNTNTDALQDMPYADCVE